MIAKKSANNPNVHRAINKMWFTHKMVLFRNFLKIEALIDATVWMNLENIMLNERSQTEKATY